MPLVSAESLASNVAQVRPMMQARAPAASVPTSAAVMASVPSTEATRYQNVNVNINGVVKNLLIPLSESQTITKAATFNTANSTTKVFPVHTTSSTAKSLPLAVHTTTSTAKSLPVAVHSTTSTAKSLPGHITTSTVKPFPLLSGMHQQVIRMGPKVEGFKTLGVLPPGTLPQKINPGARPGASMGNHILLQVPNPNEPDKFKYVLVQQPPTVNTLPQSAQPGKVAVSSSERVKVAQQKLTSVLHKELSGGSAVKQSATKVVYPGLNKTLKIIPTPSATASASPGAATKMVAPQPLKIDSVFSLRQQTASATSTSTFPTGVIEIKPEPMDTGYEPTPPVQMVDPPKPQSIFAHEQLCETAPSTSVAAPGSSDYEVLAEWEARPDSSRLLGPDFAKKKALGKKGKGIKYPIISYCRPPQKRSLELSPKYRIKRSTVDLERLDELMGNIQQYMKGKTLRRATAFEKRVIRAKTRRIQKTEQRKRRKQLAKKRELEKFQTSLLKTQTTPLTIVTPVSDPPASFSSPQMLPPQKPALATAAGANKPALVTPETQTVSVDKRKYLMVKTAAGSFLVPVSPGMGGSNINKTPPVTAFQAVGPSMKLGPGATKLVPSETERSTGNQQTKTTTQSLTSASVSTGSARSAPSAATSSAPPAEKREESVPREERIRLLKEKLKKQQEEMESAHRLHEKAKSALESIDLL